MRLIGYTPWDEETDAPYQPTLGSGWRARKKPITVYKTQKMAGPGAREVYVK